jgi:uncharacterized repeat protein (TIGR01451 family)
MHQIIPAAQMVPAFSASAGTCAFEGNVGLDGITPEGGSVACLLNSLAPGATWTITVGGRVPPSVLASVASRTVNVAAASPDANMANNVDTTAIALEQHSDLTVTQSTSTPAVVETDPVAFHATVHNAGPSDAFTVMVEVQVPSALAIGRGVTASGIYDTDTSRWNIPRLRAGATASIDLSGVAQAAGTSLATVRVVSSTSTDALPADNSAQTTVTVAPGALSLGMTLTATLTPGGTAHAGDTIAYRTAITNTGNLSMSQINVSDALTGSYACPQTTLTPGAAMICTALTDYRVTQSDVDADHPVANSVTALARAPGALADVTYGPALASTAVVAGAPALGVTSAPTVSPTGHQGAARTGDTVTFQHQVTNTGNRTMSQITVSDTLTGTATCPSTTLVPNATMTCTSGSAYAVTQADVDAGGAMTGTATVSARRPGALTNTGYGTYPVSTLVAPPVPALHVASSVTVSTPGHENLVAVGDVLTYQYVVYNTGNVTMGTMNVIGTLSGTASCPASTLAPGVSMTCTGGSTYWSPSPTSTPGGTWRTPSRSAAGRPEQRSARPMRRRSPTSRSLSGRPRSASRSCRPSARPRTNTRPRSAPPST